ncbi:uncharacterized protein LOC118741571 [Rhagoletis pomonella]|uniref:uncharacterized protein LOC118741571 n=1 Tax=Rhagoletis pomonella TaxID=28610 RepID=UPI00177CEF93|nr:uncharacterized protein LOC118741571 [Rhagoletis pomonella]
MERHPATSEVGNEPESPYSGESNAEENMWKKLYEQQNQDFVKLLRLVNSSSAVNNDVQLPEFDPEGHNVNARAWISTADMCMKDKPLKGSSLMLTLSRALKGQGAIWLTQVSYPDMTWNEFKEIFISRFDFSETNAAFLINLINNKPKDDECLISYAATIVTSLSSKWKTLSTEEIIVSTVLAHLAQFYFRIHRLAFTTSIQTRKQLQQELSSMSFLKRKLSTGLNDRDRFDVKRQKFGVVSSIKCYICGKPGHKSVTCKFRFGNDDKSISVKKDSASKNVSSNNNASVTCFRCQKVGHYASRCPNEIKKAVGVDSSNNAVNHRIDVCTIKSPLGILRQSGYDIMIGREILNQGVSVKMTSSELVFNKSDVNVNICHVENHFLNFEDLATDIPSEFRSESTVVAPMQIRLKDPNKTVNRRPYRLSFEERNIVRKKINELLNAGVIRPSCSPFASPILLVKKKDGSDRMCVDYRQLNDNTISDRFPLPLISDQINRLHGSCYFTTLDMASGYHQIPVGSDSIEKTAFVTPEGHYEYLAMPFGLRNAPAVFQRAVMKVLGELVHSYVVVYMDDILVLGTEDVRKSLEKVLFHEAKRKVERPLDLMWLKELQSETEIDEFRQNAVENIDRSANYEKNRFDKNKASVNKFVVGDFVLLQNEERNQTKLDPKYRGPFKIIENLDGDRYMLSAPHSNRIYKYAHDRLRKMPNGADFVDVEDFGDKEDITDL